MPTAIAETPCFLPFDTNAELNAAGVCDGGMKVDLPMDYDWNGDGQADTGCLYFNIASASDYNAKFPGGGPTFLSATCAERADDWSYTGSTDLEAKCTSSSEGDADFVCRSQGIITLL
jgi:hypothetical protein